jgi:hypothetical protein
LNPRQRTWLRKSITYDIRTCGALLFPDVLKPEISKAAQEEAVRAGMLLHTMTWHDQAKFDRGRKTFHWEHVNPVSGIQNKCMEAKSEEAILETLKTSLRIAWILKREDQELTRLGYRSKRVMPDEAYGHAGIELLKFPHGSAGGDPPPKKLRRERSGE